jgi:hypothetical protein
VSKMATTLDVVEFSDTSGQKMVRARGLPADCTIGEAINGVLSDLNLPPNDSDGRPIAYQGLHDREGRHLDSSETVGEALQSGDRVVLQPNIDAGANMAP